MAKPRSSSIARGAPNTTTGAPSRRAGDGLLDGEATDRLDRDGAVGDDGRKVSERRQAEFAVGAPVIVPDVMQDHPDAEALEPPGLGSVVVGAHVVAHDQGAPLGGGLADGLNCRVMGTAHDNNGVRARVDVEQGLAVAAVHDLEIGDERVAGVFAAEGAHRLGSHREGEWSPDLQPVGTGLDGDRSHPECVLDRREIE